ncbi:UNKNOWN [Stylonychia lemnae]|uniref:Uncharacterized protein n=1 Tax=Stylonychia lemnae TaxID=5949 RepID=A0A078B6T7_STYLE|nr:UNKNOWN [Stylonychia lemnae]|eukprot:CDW89278.1 UNKNOWN [Stylonychia lemnae]
MLQSPGQFKDPFMLRLDNFQKNNKIFSIDVNNTEIFSSNNDLAQQSINISQEDLNKIDGGDDVEPGNVEIVKKIDSDSDQSYYDDQDDGGENQKDQIIKEEEQEDSEDGKDQDQDQGQDRDGGESQYSDDFEQADQKRTKNEKDDDAPTKPKIQSPTKSPFTKSPMDSYYRIGSGDSHLKQQQDKSFSLPDVRAEDSASQYNKITSISQLRNIPFASNLENAKMLVQLTRERNFEYERQKRSNKYLSQTLKVLNLNVDVLIEQHNPIKYKKLAKSRITRQDPNLSQEQQDQIDIQRKIEEIKNADKHLKMTEKEYNFLAKIEGRMKDQHYLNQLFAKVEENSQVVDQIKKDNEFLRNEQRKNERKIDKMSQLQQNDPDQQMGREIQQLEIELNMLQHRLSFLQEKEVKLTQKETKLKEKQESMVILEVKMKDKEQRMIDKAQKLYGLNFQDKNALLQQAENEERLLRKEAHLKKIGIIKQSLESNKKNYQTQLKTHLKQMKDLERQKGFLQQQLDELDSDIQVSTNDYQKQMDHEELKIKRRHDLQIKEKNIRQVSKSTDFTKGLEEHKFMMQISNNVHLEDMIQIVQTPVSRHSNKNSHHTNNRPVNQSSILDRLEKDQRQNSSMNQKSILKTEEFYRNEDNDDIKTITIDKPKKNSEEFQMDENQSIYHKQSPTLRDISKDQEEFEDDGRSPLGFEIELEADAIALAQNMNNQDLDVDMDELKKKKIRQNDTDLNVTQNKGARKELDQSDILMKKVKQLDEKKIVRPETDIKAPPFVVSKFNQTNRSSYSKDNPNLPSDKKSVRYQSNPRSSVQNDLVIENNVININKKESQPLLDQNMKSQHQLQQQMHQSKQSLNNSSQNDDFSEYRKVKVGSVMSIKSKHAL